MVNRLTLITMHKRKFFSNAIKSSINCHFPHWYVSNGNNLDLYNWGRFGWKAKYKRWKQTNSPLTSLLQFLWIKLNLIIFPAEKPYISNVNCQWQFVIISVTVVIIVIMMISMQALRDAASTRSGVGGVNVSQQGHSGLGSYPRCRTIITEHEEEKYSIIRW